MQFRLARLFHRRTEFSFPHGIPDLNLEHVPEEWKIIQYKTYERAPRVMLPEPLAPPTSLTEAIAARSSATSWELTRLPALEELATIFTYACGLKTKDGGRRHYPSAGARFPLEAYLVVRDSADARIAAGVYHYAVRAHALERLFAPSQWEELYLAGLRESSMRTAPAALILTAVFDRTFVKYGNRGYRFALMEAGHVVQNALLLFAALNIKARPACGFRDDDMNKLLDIHHDESERALYMVLFGK